MYLDPRYDLSYKTYAYLSPQYSLKISDISKIENKSLKKNS